MLEAKNKGSATYYVPGWVLTGLLPNADPKTHQFEGKTHQPEGKRHQSQEAVAKILPEDLEEIVTSLSKKAPYYEVQSVILRLCQWRQLSADEIATILRRDKKHLVRKHLSVMIDAGQLEYEFLQMPKHPYQTYRRKNSTTSPE